MTEGETDIDKETDIVEEFDSARIKHFSQLMLDLKQGMMEDFNLKHEDNVLTGKEALVFRCSRQSREQADKARVYIEYFYTFVMKTVSNREDTPHCGVDNVYNPLQVIRNRKIRNKHGDKVKDFHVMKPPVIAIKDFSQRTSKFPWYVDIMEKSSDLVWRTNHWDELRKADNTLWFAQEKPRGRKNQRHVPKGSVNSVESFTEDSSFEEGTIRKHIQNRLSRNSNFKHDLKESSGSKALLSRLSRGSNKKQHSVENTVYNNENAKLIVPKIVYDDAQNNINGKSAINEIKIGSIKKSEREKNSSEDLRISSSEVSEKSKKGSSATSHSLQHSHSSSVEDTTREIFKRDENGSEEASKIMLDHHRTLKYFMCSFHTLRRKEYILDTVFPHSLEKKHDHLLNDFIRFDNALQNAHILLDEYQVELTDNVDMVTGWKTRILSDYLNRVNSLISSSDRFLSDINTTLTLRLKVLQENVDKLGVIKHIQRRTWNKLMYRILELLILCCMWIIWIIFTFIQTCQIAFVFIYKVVRWALF